MLTTKLKWLFKSFNNKSTCARSPNELRWSNFSFLYRSNGHNNVSKLKGYHSVYYAGTDKSSYDQTAYALTHLVLAPVVYKGPELGHYTTVPSAGTDYNVKHIFVKVTWLIKYLKYVLQQHTIALHNKITVAQNKPCNQAPHSWNAALMPCVICNMQWHLLLLFQAGHVT